MGLQVHENQQSIITFNNSVKIFTGGEETFTAIKNALTSAKYYINLEYFAVSDDKTGCEIRDILIKHFLANIAGTLSFP